MHFNVTGAATAGYNLERPFHAGRLPRPVHRFVRQMCFMARLLVFYCLLSYPLNLMLMSALRVPNRQAAAILVISPISLPIQCGLAGVCALGDLLAKVTRAAGCPEER